MTVKRTVRRLRNESTSERARGELDLLLARPGLSGADLRNLGAAFTKLSGASAVTEAERDAVLAAVAKMPEGQGG